MTSAIHPVIRPVMESDAESICEIYNYFAAHTTINFEINPVTPSEMARRIRDISADYPWFVADTEEGIVAYAYAARWRARAAYDHTVETTIYVRHNLCRSGVGLPLYTALLAALRQRAVHTAIACIALPNPASVAFHERCGFRKVGHLPEVGRKFGHWIDVGFWQIVLSADTSG